MSTAPLLRASALALAALLALPGTPAWAQQQPERRVAAAAEFWFDPTQLPAFTGTVERYLVNPRGETDALLFREGPQIVFPPEFGEAVRRAAPAGRPVIVWGIRARHAPVITMLAFAPNEETQPVVVDRFYWRRPGLGEADQARPVSVSGTVRGPYYTPQGEVAGVILEDGTVISIAPGSVEALGDQLRRGARIAAEGRGVSGEEGTALDASRIGENAEALQPVPAPTATPRRR